MSVMLVPMLPIVKPVTVLPVPVPHVKSLSQEPKMKVLSLKLVHVTYVSPVVLPVLMPLKPPLVTLVLFTIPNMPPMVPVCNVKLLVKLVPLLLLLPLVLLAKQFLLLISESS